MWLYRRFPTWERLDRFIVASLPVLIVVIGDLTAKATFHVADWDAQRLAPTFALVHGYQLYYGPTSGPALCTMYGPVTALSYLPATLARAPAWALLIAKLIALSFFFFPMLWLLLAEHWRNVRDAVVASFTFICFFLFSFHLDSLASSATAVHADASALCFGGFACAFLWYRKQADDALMLLLSSACVWLSVYAKLQALPMIFALPLYVLIADGRRPFTRYFRCLFGSGLVLSALFLWIFNPRLFIFNTVTSLTRLRARLASRAKRGIPHL